MAMLALAPVASVRARRRCGIPRSVAGRTREAAEVVPDAMDESDWSKSGSESADLMTFFCFRQRRLR